MRLAILERSASIARRCCIVVLVLGRCPLYGCGVSFLSHAFRLPQIVSTHIAESSYFSLGLGRVAFDVGFRLACHDALYVTARPGSHRL